MYKYPKEIHLGAHTYTITLLNQCGVDDYGKNVGDCDNQKYEIRVATLCSDGKQRALSYLEETLVHEFVHTVNEVYSCELDEKNIDRMGQGLAQILNSIGVYLVKESQ